MKIETYRCDIDNCNNDVDTIGMSVQVIFTTDQTEGRPTINHFSTDKLDLCNDCKGRLLNGNYIFAHGAQGCNTYYFKTDVK